MRLVNIEYIDCEKYEYYVAKSIYKDGLVLLEKDVKLTNSYIRLLISKKMNYIYVSDELSQGIEITEIIPTEKYREIKENVKDQFNLIKKGKDIGLNMNMINDTASYLLDIVTSKRNISYNINQIKSVDDYLYEHCLNVALSCLYTGIAMGFNKMKLHKLAMGALLHDIGKIFVDQNILNKPGPLSPSERSEIEKHPELGYRYINDKNYEEISPISRQIILQHHERWNGKGYPNQLNGDSIYELARICGICDVFDAITSDRVYRKGMPVYIACEYIYSLASIDFDFNIVRIFLSKVTRYKEGKLVKLSDNSKGIVFKQSDNYVDRPVIKLLITSSGKNVISQDIFIDMVEEKTLFIIKEIESLNLN